MEEADFEQLMLKTGQSQIVHHVCRIMARELKMEEAPVRGFFWRSLRDWQLDRQMPTEAIAEMKPEARLKAAQEIGVFFRARLRRSYGEDEKERIELAWDEAFRTYTEDYSGRAD